MSGFWPAIVTITTAIVGLAVVATVLSKRSDTANVVSTAWGGFSDSIRAATGPVTDNGGGGNGFNLGGLTLPSFGTFASM